MRPLMKSSRPALPARILLSVIALTMAASVVVQYNDPDPIRWMALYGATGACAVLALLGRPSVLPALPLAASLVWLAMLAPSVTSWSTTVETARESGGLFIAAFFSALLLAQWRAHARGSRA